MNGFHAPSVHVLTGLRSVISGAVSGLFFLMLLTIMWPNLLLVSRPVCLLFSAISPRFLTWWKVFITLLFIVASSQLQDDLHLIYNISYQKYSYVILSKYYFVASSYNSLKKNWVTTLTPIIFSCIERSSSSKQKTRSVAHPFHFHMGLKPNLESLSLIACGCCMWGSFVLAFWSLLWWMSSMVPVSYHKNFSPVWLEA